MLTNETIDYNTHAAVGGPQPHSWRYLGRGRQAYRCVICQLLVMKADLKEATDA